MNTKRDSRRSEYRSSRRNGRNNNDQQNYLGRDLYETNARAYRGEDRNAVIYRNDDPTRHYRARGFRRLERRDGWHDHRDNRNFDELEYRGESMWDRMSNNDDRDYASEYERDRLERELGHGSRGGFGYSRYRSDEYADQRSIDDDITDYGGYSGYNEDLENRRYDNTQYSEESGYSDPWRGERNLPYRRPRTSRRRREYQR